VVVRTRMDRNTHTNDRRAGRAACSPAESLRLRSSFVPRRDAVRRESVHRDAVPVCWADYKSQRGYTMPSDYEFLRQLNIDIGKAEARGATEFFEELLAPAFAMRRADGKRIDDRERFIASVAESADRPTKVDSITFFEANRALVVCTVTMDTADGYKRFHNLRLFTRPSSSDRWQLLAWANEPTE
jgi:hypothetical protein